MRGHRDSASPARGSIHVRLGSASKASPRPPAPVSTSAVRAELVTPEQRPRVLVVDDDAVLRNALSTMLAASEIDVLTSPDGESALRTLQREDIDLVLTDLVMPGIGGAGLLQQVRELFAEMPVIVMTSFGSVESAVSLMHSGAADYLPKPLAIDQLLNTVHRVLEASRTRRERARATRQLSRHFSSFMGRSLVMQRLLEQVDRVGPASSPVLITGETGVGKELIALAVHNASGRVAFVAVNSGAIPPTLLESELFGHVRGAFTGADRDRIGLFEAADGGTLFLDEIAELPLALQTKLLRVLQSGELRRVGDVEPRHVKVRLIAATHRDLAAAVVAGTFREDLFYRISVLGLEVPPLRERATDIPLLADQFLADIADREGLPEKRFSPAAQAYLAAFAWPGNVRQLRNAIERLAVLVDGNVIDVDDLPDDIRGEAPPNPVLESLGREFPLADIEREHVLGVLARVGGNRSRAAAVLGIPRRTLYRRLEEYGALYDDE